VDSIETHDEASLVGGCFVHDPRPALAVQGHAGRETFYSITPEVHLHLPAKTVGLDDAPDLERGTLVGHG
jgi:hypothetical protein